MPGGIRTARESAAEHQFVPDLDNLPPLYPDEDWAWGSVLGTASDATEALHLAQELTGAADNRWANFGVAGEDYVDYVRAGTPSQSTGS